MAEKNTAQICFPWRKAKRATMFRCSFFLLLAGFVAGYIGGVYDVTPLLVSAFILWAGACVLTFLVRAKD